MENLLNVALSFMPEGFSIHLNWLGQFVRLIVEGVGSVGLGIILFTLILKAITTPFDIYQRIKMRKQTLIMRNMQDDLQKLQKQYANDKQMYNQKMMELQKKNGYSLFGACLPMILSLVILIVAVNGFQAYANYANLDIYAKMATAYNDELRTYTVAELEDPLDIKNKVIEGSILGEGTLVYTYDAEKNELIVSSTESNLYVSRGYNFEETKIRKNYYIDVEKAKKNPEIAEFIATKVSNGSTEDNACLDYFQTQGAKAAAEWFRTKANAKFLWIKNVWYPDVSYESPIVSDYSKFSSKIRGDVYCPGEWEGAGTVDTVFSSGVRYNILTQELGAEKDYANGYYILIVLTIGTMVLSQFISMKSQKESNQYQTVDGQGARTQKMMMFLLPMIYAITGFMWTAAFSIYIAVSSIISIIMTLITNFFIGIVFKKKEEESVRSKYERVLPWQQQEKEKKGKRK